MVIAAGGSEWSERALYMAQCFFSRQFYFSFSLLSVTIVDNFSQQYWAVTSLRENLVENCVENRHAL